MKAYLKLVRWQNLIIVAFTMIMMRYAVIGAIIEKIEISLLLSSNQISRMALQFPFLDFIILVIATVLITGAGYIINDYFDIKTDLINRGKVIVGIEIPRRKAIKWHNLLNLAGVIAGFYVSWKSGNIQMGMLFIVVSGLLYFYSASYKRHFLIGNIVVALLTALVPMLVVFFEVPAIKRYYEINAVIVPDVTMLFYWVGGFAIFAFLTTLTREIIKDIEDFDGDVEYGRKTLPIIAGVKTTKKIVVWLIRITVVLLIAVWLNYLGDIYSIIYLSVAVLLPLIYVSFLIERSTTRKQFHTASRLMKIIMLTGILFSVLFRFVI